MTYDSALNKQRFKNQRATLIAGAARIDLHFLQWWHNTYAEKFGFGRIMTPQWAGMRHGHTLFKIPEYMLEHANDPGWRFVEVWAPAHIMRQALGCDIFVLGFPNG